MEKQTKKQIEEEIEDLKNANDESPLSNAEKQYLAELKARLDGYKLALEEELEFLKDLWIDECVSIFGKEKVAQRIKLLEESISPPKAKAMGIRKTRLI